MILEIITEQRAFFNGGQTLSYAFRMEQLHKLQSVLKEHEEDFYHALYLDLNKSAMESYLTEMSLIYQELKVAIKQLKRWMKVKRVKGSISTFLGKSYIMQEPYGVVLVISPWNYPLQLSLVPVISALAAGNSVILKPSTSSAHVSHLLQEVLNKVFPRSVLFVTNEKSEEVMKGKYDYIFFTGGVQTGKSVMQEAAKNLTPVTLELGGKSPCIISSSADIKVAAKRVVFGKILNSGQTCIAPDYLFVHSSVLDSLIKAMKANYQTFYPLGVKEETYPKVITERHFERLLLCLEDQEILFGGEIDHSLQKIGFTLVKAKQESQLMNEEIFGPILPIFTYEHIDDVIAFIKSGEKPLALYLFSNDKKEIRQVLQQVHFGGGAINDTLLHVSNHHLPFGGVGNSGMGHYHGEYGFLTFSHQKGILHSRNWFDISWKYPPFQKKTIKKIKKLLK